VGLAIRRRRGQVANRERRHHRPGESGRAWSGSHLCVFASSPSDTVEVLAPLRWALAEATAIITVGLAPGDRSSSTANTPASRRALEPRQANGCQRVRDGPPLRHRESVTYEPLEAFHQPAGRNSLLMLGPCPGRGRIRVAARSSPLPQVDFRRYRSTQTSPVASA